MIARLDLLENIGKMFRICWIQTEHASSVMKDPEKLNRTGAFIYWLMSTS